VNAVYSKMPVEQGVMQSRDAKNVSANETQLSILDLKKKMSKVGMGLVESESNTRQNPR
jgi:hypothetical protein